MVEWKSDDVNRDSTFKLVPRWDKYINVLEKWATLHAVMIYHLILCIRNYNETLSDAFGNMLQAWFLKQEKLLKKVWPKICHYLVILY